LLFDYKCDIIARVIYIKMSQRTDKAKIDFIQFINCFMGLLDEVKDRRNRAAFDLLEFNGDAEFDIIYLMQLFNNVSRNTMFG
jgi:hypothetical protein